MATMTAAQKRETKRLEYNAFLAECPSRKLLDRISDKWVVLILAALEERPARFSEIARTIAGVSQKMLTQTLRTLERDGLVERDVQPTVPATVTYSLTPLGTSLLSVMHQLKGWAEANMPQVDRARDRYDAR